MATAGDIANAALKRILVQASDAPLEPDEYADFIDSMNNYMLSLEAEGIRLGYTVVDNVSDEVTVPTGAIRGMIANLAIEVSPDFGGSVSSALVEQARQGMQAMRLLGQSRIKAAFPLNLPIGSGNEDEGWTENHFYPEQTTGLLTLSGNSLLTVFASATDYVPIVGFWKVARATGIQGDTTGTLTAVKATEGTVKASVTATGDGDYKLSVMANGILVASVDIALTAVPSVHEISYSAIANAGDYVRLGVRPVSHTEPMTAINATLEFI